MNENIMHYKGYPARVAYSPEDGCLVGRVLGVRDIIGFHGDSVAEVEQDFHDTVDFYLESCRRRGKAPDEPTYEDIPFALPAHAYFRLSRAAEATGRTPGEIVAELIQAADLGDGETRETRRKPKAKRVTARAKTGTKTGNKVKKREPLGRK